MTARLQWSDIALPWQICLEESWDGFCAKTHPIGAAVFSQEGTLLSRARNHCRDAAPQGQIGHHDLAHAEVNALLQIDRSKIDTHTCVLYTAVEPCPLCMGAIYMAGVRDIRYAARDSYAGSTNLLGTTPYLSLKPVRARGPIPELEDILIILLTVQYLGYDAADGTQRFLLVYDDWNAIAPGAVARGIQLHKSGELQLAAQKMLPASQVIESILND